MTALKFSRLTAAAFLGCLLFFPIEVKAGALVVPNYSFESPSTTFVSTFIDSWQKTPKREGYNENGVYLWDQLCGIFKNTAPTSFDHIDNCDQQQAMWIFAVSQAGVFQDYDTVDYNDPSPSHALNVRYESGKSYDLTIGLIGGGGNMLPEATLEVSLYYRDSLSNMVVVASTSVTNTPQNFTNTTHLVDFRVHVPPVNAADPWLGQNLGIRLLSTVSTNFEGGYWDVDNVRLAIRNSSLTNLVWTNGQFQFTVLSEPGLRFQILASDDALLPRSNWVTVGTVTNLTGAVQFVDPGPRQERRFYQAVELP